MLDHQETLDTAAQDLDEARAKIDATREALQAVLDAEGGDQPELRAVIARLGRMGAEVAGIEERVGGTVPVASGIG